MIVIDVDAHTIRLRDMTFDLDDWTLRAYAANRTLRNTDGQRKRLKGKLDRGLSVQLTTMTGKGLGVLSDQPVVLLAGSGPGLQLPGTARLTSYKMTKRTDDPMTLDERCDMTRVPEAPVFEHDFEWVFLG